MQILVASDLHYELPHYDWLLDQAADFDVLALVGDHLSVASAVPLSAQIVVISRYLERLGERTTVVTCSGNHDLDGPGAEGEQDEKPVHAGISPGSPSGVTPFGRLWNTGRFSLGKKDT